MDASQFPFVGEALVALLVAVILATLLWKTRYLPASTQQATVAWKNAPASFKVALVENSDIQAEATTRLLARFHATVTRYCCGKDAIEQITRDVDIVLLDYCLPDMTGEDVLHVLRYNLPPAVPVVFLSGRRDVADFKLLLRRGADDCVDKPLRADHVVRLWMVHEKRALETVKDADRKEADRKELLENIADAVVVADSRMIIQHANTAACEIFCYNRDDLVGKNVHVLMDTKMASEHDAHAAHHLKSGQRKVIGVRGRKLAARRSDGTMFPVSITLGKCSGKEIFFTAVFRDLTNIHEAYNAREKSVLAVQQAENRYLEAENALLEERICRQKEHVERIVAETRSKTEQAITSSLFHELRNDTQATSIALRLLDEGKETTPELIRAARASSEHCADLIENVMDYGKLRAGELVFASEPLSLHVLCNEVHQTMNLLFGERLDVRVECPDTCIVGSRRHLKQVLQNLMSNSCKFTKQGFVQLKVEVLSKNTDATLCFKVQDTGEGIPEDKQEDVFKKYFQLGKKKGTGLGLPLCQQFVEHMGGTLDIESPWSEMGRGTMFYFTLTFPVGKLPKVAPAPVPLLPMHRLPCWWSHTPSSLHHKVVSSVFGYWPLHSSSFVADSDVSDHYV